MRNKPVRQGRAFFVCRDGENAGEIAAQLNLQFAVLGHEDNRVNQRTQNVRSLSTCCLAFVQSGVQVGDLSAIDLRHPRVQQWRRRVGCQQPGRQFGLAGLQALNLRFD
ncbi:MAG: hypothetical protein ACKVP5_08485 [Aestuariivirga sp.]